MKKQSTFLRIFSYMKKNLVLYLSSLLIIGIFMLGVQIFLAILFQEMFDAIAINNLDLMIEKVRYYTIIVVGIFILFPIFSYIVANIIAITTGNIRKAIYEKLKKLPVSYFKNNHSGDIVSRMTNDVSETEKIYDDIFIEMFTSVIVALGTLVFSIMLDWRLGVVSFISASLTLFVNVYYMKIIRILSQGVQEKLAKLNETLTNLLDGVRVIRVFNLQKLMMDKIRHRSEEVYDQSIERVKKQSIISALNFLSGFVSFGGLTALGAYFAIRGDITVGLIIAVIQLQNGPRQLANSLGQFITNMQASLAAGDRVFEVLDEEEEPEVYQFDTMKHTSLDMIEMHQLSFQYDDEGLILNGLSMHIPKGKVYALVGPSGGGKSTVFKLLLNFYKPNKGDLLIDGKSISQQAILDVRKQMAYVPQDAYLFTGTILDNIKHGNNKASMDEIIEATKAANAHEFIMTLEDGYDTKVGERGTQLSGGQRQRIAIARAILKNAPILLLDEATSSLDTESEHLVQEALKHLMIGKTTLIVAHRLQTIQDADQILVLQDGHIVEQGTHLELLKQESVYKNLYDKQFNFA